MKNEKFIVSAVSTKFGRDLSFGGKANVVL
jgi:hypothetical protein